MGERNSLPGLAVGLVLSFAVYGIFDRLLQLDLPAGPVELTMFGG